MSRRRKDSLARALSYVERVEQHLEFLVAAPRHTAINHWKHEIRIWLSTMEEALKHVGKKTAAEWQARIDAYREALDEAGRAS